MKVISFLGIANYSKTCYVWNGNEKETEFFPEAVFYFTKPEKILICLTPTAREGEKSRNWQELKRRFERDSVPFEPLPIPEGHSEPELWEIFDALTNAVQEGEEVVFDITNSFRSLPFLSFLAIAYLKAAKKVQVKNVLYGAWEAKNADNRSPVFDLTPFVSLLDWLTATEQFIQTGNARQLASLLRQKGKLQKAANTLQMISQAALLCQPFTLMQTVPRLLPDLQAAQEEMAVRARPFRILNERINQEFGQFEADFPNDPKNILQSEYRLIEWYYENNQLIQAMSLAREFLIDAVQYRLSGKLTPESFARGVREDYERAVSGLPKVGGPHPKEPRGFTVDDLNSFGQTIYQTWLERDLLKKTWSALEVVRNGLDHAEHQKAPLPLESIQKKAERDVMPGLRQLAKTWNLA